jgi:uroporphyrinogen decarboxylase
MTPRDYVLAAGHSERVDRIPVTPYMGNYGAAVVGVPIDEYCADATTMAQAQLEAQKLVGQDMLVAQSDGYYMAEALGMTTRRRPNTTPAPESWPIADLAQVDGLRVPDPRRNGRMPIYLDAIRQLREAAGEELAVRACGTGAFSLAGHMMGPDNFVMALALLDVEPDEDAERCLTRLMEVAVETTISFALAALEEGADLVMNGDSLASLDMISPAIYERWAYPYERAFFDRVRPEADARGALTLLHICGDTTPILHLSTTAGEHILEIDWKVDPAEARRAAGSVALMGNLDPTSVLLQGTPDDVRHRAREAIAAATGGGFLLGSGCEVAPATPIENMRAMVEAGRAVP